jgi:gamma-glutamyltranspeptidase/glutathione hydrolase
LTTPAESVDAARASFTGAIAAPHTLATEAGLNALRDGGTAIDAAIAAAAVLTVVYPHNVALGSDLIALVRGPDGKVHCVNSSGWAPCNTDAATLRSMFGHTLPARDVHTLTVPGGVRGWKALRGCGSRLSWSDTLAAAEDAAAEGVPLAPSVAWHLLHPENADLHGTTDFDRVFRPDGRTIRAGELLRQPELAASFSRLRAGGPDEFYEGSLAARSIAYLQSRGSQLAPDDFADFRPEITAPLETAFGDLTVLTSPPNTHGFILLRVLRAIEELGLADPLGEDFGTVMRLFHRANRLRDDSLADPRQVSVDVDALLHDDLTSFSPVGHARDSVLVPNGDTVGVSAMDSDGCAVSLIQSVFYAFGSGLIDPETGILFHNRGTGFSLDEHAPNVIAPRKRPAHTLMPAMTLQDRSVRHILSTMGGQGQPQILAQILLHATRGATAQSAVAAPRGVVGPQHDGATDDLVSFESDSSRATREALAGSGLFMLEVPPKTETLGQANVVFAEPDGRMSAASDPRSDGSAAVAHYPRATGAAS